MERAEKNKGQLISRHQKVFALKQKSEVTKKQALELQEQVS